MSIRHLDTLRTIHEFRCIAVSVSLRELEKICNLISYHFSHQVLSNDISDLMFKISGTFLAVLNYCE